MKIGRRGTLIIALILLALPGISIGLFEISSINVHLELDQFQKMIGEAGLMGPALLAVFCALGTCFFIPSTVFVGIGAAVFGPYLAFACVWSGSMAGAAVSYLAARKLGREFVYSIIGERLKKYDNLIEHNGFKTVLFLRLMFVPFAPMNYGAGLTKVRFWDFFFATALGEAITICVIALFFGEIRQIWILGDLARLFSTRMALSLGFLIALALVAKLVHRKYENRLAPSLSNSHRPPDDHSE